MSEVAAPTERCVSGETAADPNVAPAASRNHEKDHLESKDSLSSVQNNSSNGQHDLRKTTEMNATTSRSSPLQQDENVQLKDTWVPLGIVKQPPSPRPPSSQTSVADVEEGRKSKEPHAKQPPPTPLPIDLRRILNEVALSGESTKLAWNEEKRNVAIRMQRPAAVFRPNHNRKRARTSLNHQFYPNSGGGVSGGTTTATATATATATNTNTEVVTAGSRSFLNAINRNNTRKRPLVLMKAPGSVCSGRASGSEQEDTSQYDSEGTSVTSTSELSFDQGNYNRNLLGLPQKKEADTYKSLRDAFKSAIVTVLDYFYKDRGGYKMSPAEKRQAGLVRSSDEEAKESSRIDKGRDSRAEDEAPINKDSQQILNGVRTFPSMSDEGFERKQQEITFQRRKKHLLDMLGHSVGDEGLAVDTRQNILPQKAVPDFYHDFDHAVDAPPFTIQRIAEVLLSPERYYTQTHKLLNCLEKLLLVKSSANAFGGSTGGDKTPIVKDDHDRGYDSERSWREIQKRRLRRLRPICLPDEQAVAVADAQHERAPVEVSLTGKDGSPPMKEGSPPRRASPGPNSPTSTRNILRGLDAHSRATMESRAMTNSPPPPNLSITLPAGHLLRHNSPTSPSSPDGERRSPVARPPSPIVYNSPEGSPTIAPLHSANHNIHPLHMHHAAVPYAGSLFSLLALNHENALGIPHGFSARDLEVESRSSASSDFDSESDYDDSASDRSDGSDYEPLSAASRAMALNRMQQQHRMQNRVLSSLQNQETRPPADSEYQSGDSVDSTRAEDSGGSDSSSSDMAD